MRGGSSIETRIAFEGAEAVKKQLQDLANAGEKALSDLQKHFGTTRNPFSALTTGANEVKRHFDNLATSSQRTGNTVRASLLAATTGTASFGAALHQTGGHSRNLQHSLMNLSFQANDVFTGLASGQDAMRIFAQQSGQIFQIFQTGGGPRVILGAAATAIGNLITPSVLAGAAIAALAVGFGLLIARAQSSEQSAKSFDVTLKALGKSSQASGKDLEAGAQSLRDVGLNAEEARTALRKAIVEGVKPQDATRIVRIGANVAAALGEGKEGIDRFTAAAGKGGDALREYGEKLNIIPRSAKEVAQEIKQTRDAIDEAAKSARAFNDIQFNRRQAIGDERRKTAQDQADLVRKTNQEIKDLTRDRGTAEEEIKLSARRQSEEMELASSRRIIDINRQTNREIRDLLVERSRKNAEKLKEFNQKIEDDAQNAAGASLIAQIEERTKGAVDANLTPIGRAFRDIGIAWNDLMNTMSQSSVIQGALTGLQGLIKLLSEGFKSDAVTTIALIIGGITGLGIAAAVIVPIFTAVATGVGAIIAGFTSLVVGAGAVGTALLAVGAAIGWPAVLLAGIVALVASFVNWKDVLSGKTWKDFLGTLNAFWDMLKAIAGFLGDVFVTAWNAAWAGLQTGFTAVVQWFSDQITNIKNWFLDLAKTIGDTISKALGFGGGMAAGGLVPVGMAGGGGIFGQSGIDRVPIWATAGEYMIRKSSVDYLGAGFLNMVNRFPERLSDMLNGGRFALGGLIDWQPPVFSDNLFARGGLIEGDLAEGGGDRVPVDLTVDGQTFHDMLTPTRTADAMASFAHKRRMSSGGPKPSWYAGR